MEQYGRTRRLVVPRGQHWTERERGTAGICRRRQTRCAKRYSQYSFRYSRITSNTNKSNNFHRVYGGCRRWFDVRGDRIAVPQPGHVRGLRSRRHVLHMQTGIFRERRYLY